MAQDTYDAANFAGSDLNGTARFVGMGGALGALGGDISTMGTNPAGTGLMVRSEANFGLSGMFTDEKGQLGHDGSRASLDHAGVVFALDQFNRSDKGLQYINVGVNYVKRRNHFGNMNTNVQNLNGMFSQTYQMAGLVADNYNAFGDDYDAWGTFSYFGEPMVTFQDEATGDFWGYDGTPAQAANYRRATYGSTSQADVNFSFNVSNRFYYGVTMGVYDVNYHRESSYWERGVDGMEYTFNNWYDTNGEGYDLKFGFICRPVENSPFRFGVAIHTPTWYRLEDVNGVDAFYDGARTADPESNAPFEYDYRTPWKFALSLGHTVGRTFAIGAEYEYSDYSTAKYEARDWANRDYFRAINDYTKDALKGVHTFKIGAEWKPDPSVAIRAGYNYVSSPFKNDAYRVIAFDSPFTETDYTNWKGINRFTVGVGFRFNGGYFDLAYQYQTQKGDFYAFDSYKVDQNGDVYIMKPTSVNNDRSQLLATLGFRW